MRSSKQRIGWIAALVIGLSALALPAGAADPTEVVQRYFAAHAEGDVAAMKKLLTKDATIVAASSGEFSGDRLDAWMEWERVLDARMKPGAMRVEDDAVIVDGITERSKFYEGMDLGEVTYQDGARFTVSGKRISRIELPRLQQQFGGGVYMALRELTYWAREDHLESLNVVMPLGESVYNAEAARHWLKLLEGWNAWKRQGDAAGSGS